MTATEKSATDAIARAEALLAAASGECPPCVNGPCVVPCGYHCTYPYTDDSTMWAGNCPACHARWAAQDRLTAPAADLLRGYGDAIKGLEDGLEVFDPGEFSAWAKSVRGLLDQFERLFPED